MGRHALLGALLAVASLVLAPVVATADPISLSGGEGGPISIVVRDAPITEVFEMLARKEEVNVLVGKDVEGEVSVNLFEVSLDYAIRGVAEAGGYVAERRRGSYVIMAREEAGQDAADGNTVIRAFKIEYSDADQASDLVESHLSRYGSVTVLAARRLLVVEDLPEFIERVDQLLAEIDRDPHQLLIEAKILEVTLDDAHSFGIDWARTFAADDGTGTIGVRDLATPGGAGLFFDLLNSDIEVALTALSAKGRVRTLSTPRLRVLEHEEAEVVIGDRLGFRVTTTINEVTTESVEFLESGVILRVTASVDRRGRIVLEIHPEVSTGTIADGLPSQTTTEVTTKLVTESGAPVFIAGLIKDRATDTRSGVPYLSDIPWIGRLFSKIETLNVNTETVVLLTARRMDDGVEAMNAQMIEKAKQAQDIVDDDVEELEGNFSPRGSGPPGDPDWMY